MVSALPGAFDVVRLAAGAQRGEVFSQVGGDGELAPAERGVCKPDDAVAGCELQVTKLRPGLVTMTSTFSILIGLPVGRSRLITGEWIG